MPAGRIALPIIKLNLIDVAARLVDSSRKSAGLFHDAIENHFYNINIKPYTGIDTVKNK